MKVWRIAMLTVVAAVLLVGGQRDRSPAVGTELASVAADPEPAPVRVGVILNYLDDPFFVAIYEGVTAEAERLGVHATVRSVTSNSQLTDQAAQLRALVAQDNDCYVVNPITGTNLVPALRGVRRPVVNVDSPVDPAAAGVRITTYIGTDDFASGRLAGEQMAALLPRGGEVALVGGIADNVNSGVRLRGFERGIRGSRVKVVERVNADYNRTKAQIAAERILREHPRLDGIFAVSDSMVLGIADTLRGAGKVGQIRVIGHDGTVAAIEHVRDGVISADVSQYPYVIGQMAIKACVAAARGAALPARVDAPISLLTRADVQRAMAAFPRPFRPYSDPFEALLRSHR